MLTNQELAPNVAETAAGVAQTMAQSAADVAGRQADSARFITEHGAEVVSGHAMVGEPGLEQGE
jgi:hypothetical protein